MAVIRSGPGSGADVGALVSYKPELHIFASITDDKVREQIPNFDGNVRAFALVPGQTFDHPEVVWRRFEIPYDRTVQTREGTTIKEYALHNVPVTNVRLPKELGIAYGLDTNQGTVWLQQPGDNKKPNTEFPSG